MPALVVYSVGYNIDMLEVAPTAALTSSQNNWSVLYRDTLEKFIAGEEVPVDYAVGISEDAVMISKLGPECAEGTRRPWTPLGPASRTQPEGVRHLQVHLPASTDGTYQVDADGHVTPAMPSIWTATSSTTRPPAKPSWTVPSRSLSCAPLLTSLCASTASPN